MLRHVVFIVIAFCGALSVDATELTRLRKGAWDEFVPRGKEVDAIYGDLALRNEKVTLVIAAPLPTRNANMTVRDVGGGVIDFTQRHAANDQLSAFYPGGGSFKFHDMKQIMVYRDGESVDWRAEAVRGKVVEARLRASSGPCDFEVAYSLADGDDFVTVRSTYTNKGNEDVQVSLHDSLRADRTFQFNVDKATLTFSAADDWFQQAYGVQTLDAPPSFTGTRSITIRYADKLVTLKPTEKRVVQRRLFVQPHVAALQGQAARMLGRSVQAVRVAVADSQGPVRHAKLQLVHDGQTYPARTRSDGAAEFELPPGEWMVKVAAQGRPPVEQEFRVPANTNSPTTPHNVSVTMKPCGFVEGDIRDVDGRGVPCKVAFHGIEGAESPDYGPDSSAYGVLNLQYTANGKFRAEIAPGQYEVLISRGPEHDMVAQVIQVQAEQTTPIRATLKRTVDTPGWISADFHSHSSPSGDNTGSQRGRVLNLLAEHIEFGPCTEHNRISTYTPHLREMGVEKLMATCPGMELTGGPLVINHQNAFPLKRAPRTQDGGGPVTDTNPVVQIERLAMWDDASDKLVQTNHPNLVQIVGDKDQDGAYDGGFEGMLAFMDVIEVHPLSGIFTPPTKDPAGRASRNPVFHWMQMLNLGHRIPGVINTDAHYNYHESGWRRNFMASDVDDPAKLKVAAIVKAGERGNIVMSNGPFLQVTMHAGSKQAISGDDIHVPSGEASVHVRVQCPNWLDINRVQVFVNGKPSESLNFTRRSHPEQFSDEVVKFDRRIPLQMKQDSHIIVAAAGEGLTLGRVMGPRYGKMMPVAVANPIFVDVDGDGFQPNGDLLGVPLPHKPQSPSR